MIQMDPLLLKQMIDEGRRVDGRPLDKYRDVTVEVGCIKSADGSARVKMGDTEVVAGIKVEIGTPFGDTPNEGVLMVGAEFVPLASYDFESGPPSENAIEVSRVTDRAIRESKVVDFKKLCITPGEKVWMVFVDIDVMNDDGNLIDACSIASLAALLTTKVPKLDAEGKKTDEYEGPLPMDGKPLCTTFAKISSKIVIDPANVETDIIDARLTVGTFEKDGKVGLCAMQKGGSSGFKPEEIEQIIDMAIEKSKAIREVVDWAVSSQKPEK